jgi:hypothetical protein
MSQGPSKYFLPANLMQAVTTIVMEQPAGKVIGVANGLIQLAQQQEEAWKARGGDVPELPTLEVMVDRFLAWKCPPSVCPDGKKGEQTGTNLLSGAEAREMLQHVLGLPK